MGSQHRNGVTFRGLPALFDDVLLEIGQCFLRKNQVKAPGGVGDEILEKAWVEPGEQLPGDLTMAGNVIEVEAVLHLENLERLENWFFGVWL